MSKTDRRVLRLTGSDTRDFLQNLVTNDLGRLDQGPVYAALLTPQGKLLRPISCWSPRAMPCCWTWPPNWRLPCCRS